MRTGAQSHFAMRYRPLGLHHGELRSGVASLSAEGSARHRQLLPVRQVVSDPLSAAGCAVLKVLHQPVGHVKLLQAQGALGDAAQLVVETIHKPVLRGLVSTEAVPRAELLAAAITKMLGIAGGGDGRRPFTLIHSENRGKAI